MKKRYCRISVISLLTVFLFSFVMTVSAGAEAARGLSAEIKTDKNDYVSGDRADITLTMTNGGSDTLENVSGEIVLPEDMKLISGALTTDSYVLAAGESREHKVTAVVEGSSSATSDVESTVSESSQADTSSAASSKAADTAGSVNPSTGSRNAMPWIVRSYAYFSGWTYHHCHKEKAGQAYAFDVPLYRNVRFCFCSRVPTDSLG